MYQYEIMLVVDGTQTPEESTTSVKPLKQFLDSMPNFKEEITWNDPLAYEIKKKTVCHRYLFTFKTDKYSVLEEFKKQALYLKFVLRVLIINIEKTYGYKASKNPKKISIFEHKQQKYLNHLAAKAAAAELEGEQGVIVTEAGLRKVRTYNATPFPKFKKEEPSQ